MKTVEASLLSLQAIGYCSLWQELQLTVNDYGKQQTFPTTRFLRRRQCMVVAGGPRDDSTQWLCAAVSFTVSHTTHVVVGIKIVRSFPILHASQKGLSTLRR
jgi:hypothetical protein